MSLARKIKERRNELGLSQQELASTMGYSSRSTIAKIESGDNGVPRSKIPLMARALGVKESFFFDETLPGASCGLAIGEEGERFSGESRARNIAVVLAGGSSTRNRRDVPNQFISILGKPMIIYVLEAYQRHPMIDEVRVVCLNGWEDILNGYIARYEITKFCGVIAGGDTGIRSVENAVNSLGRICDRKDVVIFQESTRPLVSEEIISKLLFTLGKEDNAIVCESMYDWVQFRVVGERVEYVDRDELLCIQSPEAYRYGMLVDAFEEAHRIENTSLFDGTYCALMLHELGYNLRFCEGGKNNIKAVRQEDVAILTALLAQGVQR